MQTPVKLKSMPWTTAPSLPSPKQKWRQYRFISDGTKQYFIKFIIVIIVVVIVCGWERWSHRERLCRVSFLFLSPWGLQGSNTYFEASALACWSVLIVLTFFLYFRLIYFDFICMNFTWMFVYVPCTCSALRGQKRGSYSLKVEL